MIGLEYFFKYWVGINVSVKKEMKFVPLGLNYLDKKG